MHADLSVLHRHLGDLGDVGIKRMMRRKAKVMTRGRVHLGHVLTRNPNDVIEARRVLGVLQTERHFIHTRGFSDFIDHRFLGKGGIGMPHRAPKSHGQLVVDRHVGHPGVGVIVVFIQPLGTRLIGRKFLEVPLTQISNTFDHPIAHPGVQGRQQRAEGIGGNIGASAGGVPSNQVAIMIDTRLDAHQ